MTSQPPPDPYGQGSPPPEGSGPGAPPPGSYPPGSYPSGGSPYGGPPPPPGPPPGYGYQPPPPPPGTNVMAILSLVFAFVFSPLGIVFGHIGKKQIRETGEQGEGLATAGLVLGYVFTGLYLAACCTWLVAVIGLGVAGTV